MGTKNNPGEFDCYLNAEADEPMFVLLARDKHAPTLVWLWATLRELDGEAPAKVAEARKCTGDMIVWLSERGRKAVGLGQASLAGVMELIRTINIHVKHNGESKTQATDDELLRSILSTTNFASEPETDPNRAINDIAAERRRQIDAEGWTSDHDDKYLKGELSEAAGNYTLNATTVIRGFGVRKKPYTTWPWEKRWWKPSDDPRRDLVKAGALIVAEIERLDRAAEKGGAA